MPCGGMVGLSGSLNTQGEMVSLKIKYYILLIFFLQRNKMVEPGLHLSRVIGIRMKKHLVSVLFWLFLATVISFAQQLEIHHIDVGQGDATLIKSPTGITALIDAGNPGCGTSIVLPYLTSIGVTKLNYVLNSHFHSDHLGGLDEVITGLGAANIDSVYDRGNDAPLPTTTEYTDFVTAANATSRRVKVLIGRVVDLGGGVTMKCVATDGQVINYGKVNGASGSENDLSIGWVLTYHSFSYFTGGDLGGEVSSYADSETPLASQVKRVNAFKVNHHGSNYSTNQIFVDSLKAQAAFISVGNGNSYKHPVQAILTRLANAGCYIYQTELGNGGTIPAGKGVAANASVVLRTSGTGFQVSYGKVTDNYGVTGTKTTTISSPQFELMQNYPNPFNPGTTIAYSLRQRGLVTVKVYDVLGKETATLVNAEEAEGMHVHQFDASMLPGGVYFYTIRSGEFAETKKMLLLK